MSPNDKGQVQHSAEVQMHRHLRDGLDFEDAVEIVAEQYELNREVLRDLACDVAASVAAGEGIAWLEEGDSPGLAEERGLEKLRDLLPADIDAERKEGLGNEVIEQIEAATESHDDPKPPHH